MAFPLSVYSGVNNFCTPRDSAKPGQQNNQIHSEGQITPTKLGIFGNGAKKRIREELPIIPEKSEDSLDVQKQVLKDLDQFENITKANQFGKPEKMIKSI